MDFDPNWQQRDSSSINKLQPKTVHTLQLSPAAIQQDLHDLIKLSIILDLTQVTLRSWVRLLLRDERTSEDLEKVPTKNYVWPDSPLSDQNFSNILQYKRRQSSLLNSQDNQDTFEKNQRLKWRLQPPFTLWLAGPTFPIIQTIFLLIKPVPPINLYGKFISAPWHMKPKKVQLPGCKITWIHFHTEHAH